MSSKSSLGVTSIRLTFDMSRDVDGAARDVEAGNQRGSQLSAPQTFPRIQPYRKIDSARAPVPRTQSGFKDSLFRRPLRQRIVHHPAKKSLESAALAK